MLEYCSGGTLKRLLDKGGMHEASAAPLLQQLVSAVAHIHASGVAHRDVKPSNILFIDASLSRLKLCGLRIQIPRLNPAALDARACAAGATLASRCPPSW